MNTYHSDDLERASQEAIEKRLREIIEDEYLNNLDGIAGGDGLHFEWDPGDPREPLEVKQNHWDDPRNHILGVCREACSLALLIGCELKFAIGGYLITATPTSNPHELANNFIQWFSGL